MAQLRYNTNLTKLLLKCMAQPDPMLSMLEWLRKELMERNLPIPLSPTRTNDPTHAGAIAVITVPGVWIFAIFSRFFI